MKRKVDLKKHKFILPVCTAVVIVLLIAAMAVTYAKYYAQESRKSVMTASGLYFSSNCLTKVDSIDDKQSFPAYVASNSWTGTGRAVLPIHIYNYDNILLYNDNNLNITYDIYFCLIDNDTEATYSIKYNNGTTNMEKTLKYNVPFVIKDQYLEGGSAKGNSYDLTISPKSEIDAEKYISGRVSVWAVPTYPSYVVEATRLAANIRMRPTKGAFSYTAGFSIENDLKNLDWETAAKARLNDSAGFVYTIKATGEAKTTYYYNISWNNEIYEIDQYNNKYIEAAAQGRVVTNGNITTMTIEAVPYSVVNISFYKTVAFRADNFNALDDFLNSVTTELVTGI